MNLSSSALQRTTLTALLLLLSSTTLALAFAMSPPSSAATKSVNPNTSDTNKNTNNTPNNELKKLKSVYDVIVIGGGSAGLTAAKLAGNTLGKQCLLIEADRMGGDCTWTGCVPSKSLIAAAKAMHAAKQYGIVDAETKADFADLKKRLQANIRQIYDEDDSPEALAKLGVTVLKGKAVLSTATTVSVTIGGGSGDGDDDTAGVTAAPSPAPAPLLFEAREGIILCTGAQPKRPATIEGLSAAAGAMNYVTYETIWDLERVPNRLTVIGGGPVGCELAQAFQRLGSQVTMIVASGLLLPREDPAASKVMEQVFETEGIVIVKGRVVKVVEPEQQQAAASRSQEQQQQQQQHVCITDRGDQVAGDLLLVATGRVPRCTGLGLEAVGVALTENDAAIAVNKKLETSIKGIYAAGDCTGDRQFTHYAGYQGAIAARNILLPLSDPGVLENVPATTFTSPEVASLGLSEADAVALHGADKIVVAERHLSHVDRAVCDGAQQGFIKIVYLKKNGQVLGATIVAPAAGEMISEIAVMMKTGMPFEQLATVMHPYPTYAMALQLMAADAYYKKTLKLKWLLDILKKLGL